MRLACAKYVDFRKREERRKGGREREGWMVRGTDRGKDRQKGKKNRRKHW